MGDERIWCFRTRVVSRCRCPAAFGPCWDLDSRRLKVHAGARCSSQSLTRASRRIGRLQRAGYMHRSEATRRTGHQGTGPVLLVLMALRTLRCSGRSKPRSYFCTETHHADWKLCRCYRPVLTRPAGPLLAVGPMLSCRLLKAAAATANQPFLLRLRGLWNLRR